MILCLDAGNTRLKWGVRGATGWLAQGACVHADATARLAEMPAGIARILACNVAGAEVTTRIEALAATLGVPLDWFSSRAACCGVINGYDDPVQLGADRWAALIGARGIHTGAALVVMAGTATTIDVLDETGCFRGGLILPGLELMQTSLARNTAGLPETRGVYRDVPTNTDDAIASGVLHATLGAIGRMARHLPGTNFLVVLSGGAADKLAPHLDLPYKRIDNLVLEGLARVAGRC